MADVKYFLNPQGKKSPDEFKTDVDAFLSGLPAGTKVAAVGLNDDLLLLYGAGIEGIAGGLSRTEVADTDYIILSGDVAVVYTSLTAARDALLPPVAEAGEGRTLLVVDEVGAAGSFAISVTPDGAEEIDGAAAAVDIAVNYGFLTLYCTGTAWKTLAKLIV